MTAEQDNEVTFDLSPAAICDPEQIFAGNVEANSFTELCMEHFNQLIGGMVLTVDAKKVSSE